MIRIEDINDCDTAIELDVDQQDGQMTVSGWDAGIGARFIVRLGATEARALIAVARVFVEELSS